VGDARFQVTHIDDLERIPLEGNQWRPVRRALGVTGFGVNAYTAAEAGDEVIEPHDETSAGAGGHEELYIVVAGSAEFKLGDERIDAPQGTLILVPVGTHRVAVATAPETTVLVIGGVPGTAAVSPFEHWYAAQGPYSRGEYDEAVAVASEGLAEFPEHPTLHYQLACFNALGGHPEKALEHLRVAATANPQVLEWASDDADLDPIRGLPGYPG
jgi:mannose-6-phosphate isomerase-like protein (cupin superfamily)